MVCYLYVIKDSSLACSWRNYSWASEKKSRFSPYEELFSQLQFSEAVPFSQACCNKSTKGKNNHPIVAACWSSMALFLFFFFFLADRQPSTWVFPGTGYKVSVQKDIWSIPCHKDWVVPCKSYYDFYLALFLTFSFISGPCQQQNTHFL